MTMQYGISMFSADFAKTIRSMPPNTLAYLKTKSDDKNYEYIIVPVLIKGYTLKDKVLYAYVTIFDPSRSCEYDNLVKVLDLVSHEEVYKVKENDGW